MASATYTLLVLLPDLVQCINHFQYNKCNTESDPHWDWFWVCDQDYYFPFVMDRVIQCWCVYSVYHTFTLSHSVWVQLLDRRQRHLQLAVIPVTAFTAHPSPPPHPSPYLLWEDTSEHWINVSNYCPVTLPWSGSHVATSSGYCVCITKALPGRSGKQ